jgi:hypothetical protein
MLSGMEYPHWIMVAGAVLVVLGFIGFAFSRNKDAEPHPDPPETKAKGNDRPGSEVGQN